MWQELIVGTCVVAAIAFIYRRYGRKSSAPCGTGACGGCGSAGQCSTGTQK